VFAHFTQGSNDLQRSASFYDALLAPLGVTRRDTTINDEVICYLGTETDLPRFFVVTPFDNKRATIGNGSMIAFTANSQEQVDQSYNGGLTNGGADEGAPGRDSGDSLIIRIRITRNTGLKHLHCSCRSE